MSKRKPLDRCDRCEKWVSQHQVGALGNLEGIVSEGVDIDFSICPKCFTEKGLDSTYWDEWVAKRKCREVLH